MTLTSSDTSSMLLCGTSKAIVSLYIGNIVDLLTDVLRLVIRWPWHIKVTLMNGSECTVFNNGETYIIECITIYSCYNTYFETCWTIISIYTLYRLCIHFSTQIFNERHSLLVYAWIQYFNSCSNIQVEKVWLWHDNADSKLATGYRPWQRNTKLAYLLSSRLAPMTGFTYNFSIHDKSSQL